MDNYYTTYGGVPRKKMRNNFSSQKTFRIQPNILLGTFFNDYNNMHFKVFFAFAWILNNIYIFCSHYNIHE